MMLVVVNGNPYLMAGVLPAWLDPEPPETSPTAAPGEVGWGSLAPGAWCHPTSATSCFWPSGFNHGLTAHADHKGAILLLAPDPRITLKPTARCFGNSIRKD